MKRAGAQGSPTPAEGVGADEIRIELERILSSSAFRSSERIRQFLRFVVEETLAGRADGIKAYSIAIDCFDREDDFDPQLDPYVRIVARRPRNPGGPLAVRRVLHRRHRGFSLDGAQGP